MKLSRTLFACGCVLLLGYGCSASSDDDGTSGGNTGAGAGTHSGCGDCLGDLANSYTPCDSDGNPGATIVCPDACIPDVGCVPCAPGELSCVGNDVTKCAGDGSGFTEVVETCDAANNLVCSGGACVGGCQAADEQPSNVGCEFWAVDLDQQDALNDPASAPWGIALSNAGEATADVTIEINTAPPGQPLSLATIDQLTVAPGTLQARHLPTREIDCGAQPNSYDAPGTCLSSQAYRIRSTAPIVVYQYNVFENAYSNDASLLLPTNALGNIYRIMGWVAGHPVIAPIGPKIIDRSAVTIVGTAAGTQVTVKPSWRIKGNPPIAATPKGGSIVVELGPFDVLNLETDDASFSEASDKSVTDLSGTIVQATKPVAVFTSVESTSAPAGIVDIPTYPDWNPDDTCCLDHLEEQMFPVEAVGKKYVITRSPIRSKGSYKEPDVLRFMGVAEVANITTNLPAPFDSFTLQPGEVRTTWTQSDVVVDADKPVMVGQLLISQGYISGALTGDPALTVFPPVEQYRSEYVILTPGSWDTNWVVISAHVGAEVLLDGTATSGCTVTAVGDLEGKSYESRRCAVSEGVHGLTGKEAFGVVAYGYGSAGSYAFAGGADVKKIYEPPEIN